jgi:catechol 2,3-dioxygenase-like lactoylglutathione lyase family enzyme
VLHHVSLEVHPDHAERVLEFLELIGFRRTDAPGEIAEYVDWVERQGTQVHLIRTPEPAIQHLGHPAFVAPDFEATVAALAEAGFDFEESRQLWGERRGFATLPGGQKVELMAAPPPSA